MNNIITRIISVALLAAGSFGLQAADNVLAIPDIQPDSTIVYPESFETDTYAMMQNWYLQNYTALDKDVESRPDVPTTDEELIERLQSIPTTIELPFNSLVRTYIDAYTGRNRRLVETMLGMSLYYMPIFEEAIEREGIPIELKYLPVIESALNPNAVSRAGAVGLWQFMLPTARGLGLEINTLVDERRDPVKSSAAAARYLHQLFDIYSDWSLAIAAYNCGPGNINKAMRRAGDSAKDFWSIYPFLPAETRGYLPTFIAATYVMNFYHKHNISPALAKRPILTDSVSVRHRVHFKQIADVLHIPVEELEILNPQYRKQEIPGDIMPCALVLPATQIYAYILSEDAIREHDAQIYGRRNTVEPASGDEAVPAIVDGQEGEWVTEETVKYHKVRRNETMSSIAKRYGLSVKQLKGMNNGISKPHRGQKLKVVTTRRVFRPTVVPPAEGDDLLVPNKPVEEGSEAPDNPEISETPVSSETSEVSDNAEVSESEEISEAEEAEATTSAKVADTFNRSQAKQQQSKAAAKDQVAGKKEVGTKKNASGGAKTVTVRKGDNLYKIARANGTTVDKLRSLNGLKNDNLKIGDKLRVK